MKRLSLFSLTRKPGDFLVLVIRDRYPGRAMEAIALEQGRKKPRTRIIAKLRQIAAAHESGTLRQYGTFPNIQLIP